MRPDAAVRNPVDEHDESGTGRPHARVRS